MEACATAHYWARELTKLGHQVRLMPAKDVKAYVKRNKNDAADAEAICEAVRRPTMRFVQVKSAEQQSQLMLHRARDLLMRQRTQVINALRAHMAELGMTAAQGNAGLRELLAIIAGAADERNLILPSPVPLGRRHQRTRPIGAALDQQCPGDAGHLVGKCHRHNLERFAGEKLREPGILLRLLSRELQHRMSSDHQNASQIAIALFRDRTELLFAAGRILPRYQPDPGRHIAARPDACRPRLTRA
jgi:hypothetical protein